MPIIKLSGIFCIILLRKWVFHIHFSHIIISHIQIQFSRSMRIKFIKFIRNHLVICCIYLYQFPFRVTSQIFRHYMMIFGSSNFLRVLCMGFFLQISIFSAILIYKSICFTNLHSFHKSSNTSGNASRSRRICTETKRGFKVVPCWPS